MAERQEADDVVCKSAERLEAKNLESVRSSSIDKNKYETVKLDNGVEILLISNPIYTTVGCAVSVGVGSYDEPAEWPGLAHFLEHMLFMGTEKYPGENEFMNFLSLHNGYSNAYTEDEITVYYCEADKDVGERMVDMLAWFFIAPLFVADSIDRELNAVDSEFMHSKNSQRSRISPLIALFNCENDSRGAFGIGNNATLKKDGILEAVKDFWKKAYGSHKIKVVVSGAESIKNMKKWVSVFERVPSIHKSLLNNKCNMPHNYNIIDIKYLGSVYQVMPLGERKELLVLIDMPPSIEHFRKNLYEFISFVFARNDNNSLLSSLKDKNLGTLLKLNHYTYKEYTRVEVTIELTTLGTRKWREIVSDIASVFTQMKINAPSILSREYLRFARIKSEEFKFWLPENPLDLVESSAAALQYYPAAHIFDWPYLCEEYDQKLLFSLLDRLADPTNWFTLLLWIPEDDSVFSAVEKHYGVKYGFVDKIRASIPSLPIHTPHFPYNTPSLNLEICDSGAFERAEQGDACRHLIREVSQNKIILLYDSLFRVPRSDIQLHIQHKSLMKTPSLSLYFALLEDRFSQEYDHFLTDNHLNVSINVADRDIVISFYGFSSGILDACDRLFDDLMAFYLDKFDFKRFELLKEEMINDHKKILKKSPFNRLVSVFKSHLHGLATVEENLEALLNTKVEDLSFSFEYFVDVIAVGNIPWSIVKSIAERAEKSSKTRPGRYQHLLPWDRVSRKATFKTSDQVNAAVGFFYRVAEFDPDASFVTPNQSLDVALSNLLRRVAIGRMLYQMSNENFFNELRTEEALGYCVTVDVINILNGTYLAFMVQSDRDTIFIQERIQKFVSDFKKSIVDMSDDELEVHLESLINYFSEPVVNLADLAKMAHSQVYRHPILINYGKVMMDIAKSLTKDDLLNAKMLEDPLIVVSEKEINPIN